MLPLRIGTSVGDYVKLREKQINAQMKMGKSTKANPGKAMNFLNEAAKFNYSSEFADAKQGEIANKMMFGMKLTGDDMEYLRATNPDLYKKAVKLKKERETHEKRMKLRKTKEQVHKMHLSKVTNLVDEYNSAKNNNDTEGARDACMKLNAVNDEYFTYTASAKFAKLPANDDELKKRRGKKGSAGTPGSFTGVVLELSYVKNKAEEAKKIASRGK
ncbi:MAG: hypothetical protein LBS21_08640 [Clostridiales bacterium]|jgi:hypothetical protein|nr:hypothetical protein [Clostridiales bacterium]